MQTYRHYQVIDLDIGNVHGYHTRLEKLLNEKKQENEASQVLGENLREKVDAITVWQDTTQSSLREIQNSVHKLPDEIYAVQEKQTLLKSEMNSRMTAESDARNREVDNLKQEIQQLKARRDPHPATIHDLENVQASVRKLADSIQTVKTVLGMKIQSEQKLRISGLEDLQTQVNQVKVNVGMPRYTSTGMKDDPSDGYDTGFASWDDPTPSHTGNPRATTQEGRKSPGDNAGMGPIPEGNETKRTNSQTSLKNQKNKSPSPSYGRNQTPSEDRNKTPSQSRNQTPTGNKTPSQSRNQTPTGNQTNSRNVTPTTGRKSATNKNNTKNDGSGTPRAEEIQKLQEEIAILRTAIEPLVKKPLPRNFVKDPNRRSDDTPDVNRHSVANAYRWLRWKSKLMYILWQIRSRKQLETENTGTSRPAKPPPTGTV
ncbi:unnamed protein product [Mytilus coruscus]|uniref:Uncharacterized protein n=1 Tax=Mytilus coruscus TaxID=42192 RepID=A0A6J8BQF3_MYTCO|nr:unnamed protein product [Mytilus coruscus]